VQYEEGVYTLLFPGSVVLEKAQWHSCLLHSKELLFADESSPYDSSASESYTLIEATLNQVLSVVRFGLSDEEPPKYISLMMSLLPEFLFFQLNFFAQLKHSAFSYRQSA
jgi:hypothetical protein